MYFNYSACRDDNQNILCNIAISPQTFYDRCITLFRLFVSLDVGHIIVCGDYFIKLHTMYKSNKTFIVIAIFSYYIKNILFIYRMYRFSKLIAIFSFNLTYNNKKLIINNGKTYNSFCC